MVYMNPMEKDIVSAVVNFSPVSGSDAFNRDEMRVLWSGFSSDMTRFIACDIHYSLFGS